MKQIPLTQGKCIDCGNPVLKISQKPSRRCCECLIKRKRGLGKISQLKYRDANREKVLQSARDYARRTRKERPEEMHKKDRKWQLKKNYGITEEEYSNLIEKQNGLCAICNKKENSKRGHLCVDHCHRTGKVRGLLCHACNRGLGSVRDNIEILIAMIKYIRSHDTTKSYDEKAKELFGEFACLNFNENTTIVKATECQPIQP